MEEEKKVKRIRCPNCKNLHDPLIFIECPYCQLYEYVINPLMKHHPEHKGILKNALYLAEKYIDKQMCKSEKGWIKIKENWGKKIENEEWSEIKTKIKETKPF